MTASATGAEDLHPSIRYHIVNTLGWDRLRPLQEESVAPVLRGDDALLLAPTASGKTEAAAFPLLTRMEREGWRGLSVLYICPLRALLNNIEPRLTMYASWVGRRAAVWHGDVGAGARQAILQEPVDVLLTTPESLEGMLVSTRVSAHELFVDLQAVVVDEIHAFAADDRGWHLLAVLERISRLAGRPLQRIGLSATVGNPEELLRWLQGARGQSRPGVVVNPPAGPGAASPDLQLDYVGSLPNAARVIAAMHRGEKRLVFADARARVEELAVHLREHGVETFLSHSSLSREERHRAERAFNEASNCVIVATSALELGIDIGDLDRVIQVGAPGRASSLLQRLGRTGRRPGTSRNVLLLATSDEELLRGAGLLRLITESTIEGTVPPPMPRHVMAQQLLALCLQEGRVGDAGWADWLDGSWTGTHQERAEVASWLVKSGHLDTDQGMLFVGPEAQRRYGGRNFLDLVSLFTVAPEVLILHGREEIGSVDPMVLTSRVDGPRVLALGGRSWLVKHIEWRRRRAFVEPTGFAGKSRWSGASQPLSAALCDAMRRVILDGELAGATVSRRAQTELDIVRAEYQRCADHEATVVVDHGVPGGVRWWTWAGARANVVLVAALGTALPGVVEVTSQVHNRYVQLNGQGGAMRLAAGIRAARDRYGPDFDGALPEVTDSSLQQLKFSDLLPPAMARATLAARSTDHVTARRIAERPLAMASAT